MERQIDNALQASHLYFKYLRDEQEAKKNREKHRDFLKKYITENCDADEDGNLTYEFPAPMNIDDMWYRGLQNQRRVREWVDEEEAKKLVYLHNLQFRCLKKVTTWELDLDELYAANQEGIISDDEIDSIIEMDETWALVKIKS